MEEKACHRHFADWERHATWGTNLPVVEMGVYPESIQKLPRSHKRNGHLYFMKAEGRMHQANLYTLGNVGAPGEITIEHRIALC